MAYAYWQQYSFGYKYILDGVYQCYWGDTSIAYVKFTSGSGIKRVCIIVTMMCSHQRDPASGNGSQSMILNMFPLDGKNGYNTIFTPTNSNIAYYPGSPYYPDDYLSVLKIFDPNATDIEIVNRVDLPQVLLENFTSFHSDPVYVEATKLTYTDGTYNFARGNKTADAARQAAYNHLLKTYGSFYRGTERELASSFATELSNNTAPLNGGG